MSTTISKVVFIEPASSTVAEMAPGPAINGSASGKDRKIMQMILGDGYFGRLFLPFLTLFKIISKAIQKQQKAAGDAEGAERNASRLRIASPKTAKTARMPKAMMEPRNATWLRWLRFMPVVKRQENGSEARRIERHQKCGEALIRVSLLAISFPAVLFLCRTLRKLARTLKGRPRIWAVNRETGVCLANDAKACSKLAGNWLNFLFPL